jgi:predicted porin
VGATYAKSDRTDKQSVGNGGFMAGGKNAEVWAAGLKYDANNIYLATTYSETRNMTNFGDGYIATKHRTLKLLLSTSSTSVCVRPSLT